MSKKKKIYMNQTPKPETQAKLDIAKKLIEAEYDVEYITKKIGYKDKATTLALLREYGVHIPRDLCCYKNESDEHWFQGKADPSNLTQEELARAKYLGITPERWAWLKLCPSSGRATHRSIYDLRDRLRK